MARSRQSLVTDLLEIASKLPWKVSLGIAAVSLLALHLVAAAFAPPPVVTNPADLGGVVIHQMIHVLAFFSQFVVPPAFVIGAVVSYFKRSRSIQLFEETRSAGGPAVGSLTWQQFETLVAEGFRQRGFTVAEKGGAAPDGGVDIVTNVAGVGMAVNAHIVDAASHQPRDFTVNIDPGHIAELGRREGYTFEPGDQLTLSHDGYKSKMWIVP